MTPEQYKEKCRDLKKEVARLIDNRTEKLLESGAIDLNDFENDFYLPKAVICSIGAIIRSEYLDRSEEGRKLVKIIDTHI